MIGFLDWVFRVERRRIERERGRKVEGKKRESVKELVFFNWIVF